MQFQLGVNNGGAILLTPAVGSQYGAAGFNSPFNATNGFLLTFDVSVVGGTSPPADGVFAILHGQGTVIPTVSAGNIIPKLVSSPRINTTFIFSSELAISPPSLLFAVPSRLQWTIIHVDLGCKSPT